MLPPPEPVEACGAPSHHLGVEGQAGAWRGQAVYVKTLVSDDPNEVARFHHEGEIAACLSHPLIPPLLAHTRTQLIFPYVPGGTLRDLLQAGPLRPDAALAVTAGVLRAAAHLHARGVTHQDLKPENVLLCAAAPCPGAVRLIDFGMSHAAGRPDLHADTRMGTPQFMAPEQFRGVRGDPRSDLYSVGVLLCDCLAGHPPHEDALGWLLGLKGAPPALPGPAALRSLLRRALSRDPARRPQSAGEMLGELTVARRALAAKLPERT